MVRSSTRSRTASAESSSEVTHPFRPRPVGLQMRVILRRKKPLPAEGRTSRPTPTAYMLSCSEPRQSLGRRNDGAPSKPRPSRPSSARKRLLCLPEETCSRLGSCCSSFKKRLLIDYRRQLYVQPMQLDRVMLASKIQAQVCPPVPVGACAALKRPVPVCSDPTMGTVCCSVWA